MDKQTTPAVVAIESTTLLAEVRRYLATLTDEQRIAFISDCMENYCRWCGSILPCYCMNDD